jgi:Flp pilus assembly protein TadG
MRWLTQRSWLTKHKRDEDGLMAITVTVLAVVMFVMVAFSVDVGSAAAITQSAQNSADAAALAVATDCSLTGSPSSIAPYLTKGQVPATDGTGMVPACDSGGTGAVTVSVSRTMDWTFGRLIPGGGLTTYTKTRAGTAKWGALGSSTGTLFPITISTCAFTTQFNVKVTLHSHYTPACPNPAGQFGFIRGGCTSQPQTIVGGQTLPGTTGNNLLGTGCTEGNLNKMLNTDVLVPVWDTATGSGANAQYHIQAYAVFHLTGWSTNGNTFGVAVSPPPATLGKQCDASGDGGTNEHDNTPCIRGIFKGFSTQTGTVVPGLACMDNILACLVYLDH